MNDAILTPVQIRQTSSATIRSFRSSAHVPEHHREHARHIVGWLNCHPWLCDQIPFDVMRAAFQAAKS